MGKFDSWVWLLIGIRWSAAAKEMPCDTLVYSIASFRGHVNGFDHADGFDVRADLVDTMEHDALIAGGGGDGDGGPVTFFDFGFAEDGGDTGFAGDADEKRAVGGGEGVEIAQQGQVVIERFTEPDARVVAEGGWVDAGGREFGVASGEPCGDFLDDIAIARSLLHGLRIALHVHDDDAAAACGAEGWHGGIGGEAADVVDDFGAGIERGLGDGSLHGVDGNESVPFVAQGADDWNGAVDFFGGIDWGGTWPRGFAADIDDCGAFGDHAARVDHCGIKFMMLAAIGKRIRRHIENPHDLGATAEVEGAGADVPDHGRMSP